MNRIVSRADCRRQFTYSDRCRECRRNVGETHADDCPRQTPPQEAPGRCPNQLLTDLLR